MSNLEQFDPDNPYLDVDPLDFYDPNAESSSRASESDSELEQEEVEDDPQWGAAADAFEVLPFDFFNANFDDRPFDLRREEGHQELWDYIVRARGGDRDAFVTLAKRLRRYLYSKAREITSRTLGAGNYTRTDLEESLGGALVALMAAFDYGNNKGFDPSLYENEPPARRTAAFFRYLNHSLESHVGRPLEEATHGMKQWEAYRLRDIRYLQARLQEKLGTVTPEDLALARLAEEHPRIADEIRSQMREPWNERRFLAEFLATGVPRIARDQALLQQRVQLWRQACAALEEEGESEALANIARAYGTDSATFRSALEHLVSKPRAKRAKVSTVERMSQIAKRLGLSDEQHDAIVEGFALQRVRENILRMAGEGLLRERFGDDPLASGPALEMYWIELQFGPNAGVDALRQAILVEGGEIPESADLSSLVAALIRRRLEKETHGLIDINAAHIQRRILSDCQEAIARANAEQLLQIDLSQANLMDCLVAEERARLYLDTGTLPTKDEALRSLLAKIADLDRIRELINHRTDTRSLDEPVADDSDRSLAETLADEFSGVEGILDSYEAQHVLTALGREMDGALSDRLARIEYLMRHGFSISDPEAPERVHLPLTRAETRAVVGVTPQTLLYHERRHSLAVAGEVELSDVEVVVTAPDGTQQTAKRDVVAIVHPERRRRRERLASELRRFL